MRWRIGVALCGLLALPSCADIECSSENFPGVELTITEEGGPHTEQITVRWAIDSGPFTDIDDTVTGCADRTFCQIGWELDGAYEIQVIRGGTTVTVFTDVRADRCHVLTRSLSVAIPDA